MAKRVDFPVDRAELAESSAECRACHAPIFWRNKSPLDVDSKQWRDGKWWLESHFARCPHADQFRRKPAVKEAMREVATESEPSEEDA